MYITEGDVENLILQDIDSSFSTWISSVIDMVGGYIDQYCGTNFSVDAQAGATKYYDTNGSDEIFIDPYTALTSITVLDSYGNDELSLSVNDYDSYPLNDSLLYRIKLRSGASISSFPERSRGIKVVGDFGYASVPAPIKLAAIKLTAKIINEGLRGGQVGSEALGSYTVNYRDVDDEAEALGVKEILNQYRVMTQI